MWRDERAISNILEEMIALAVISVALCLILTSMSGRIANEMNAREAIQMKDEARKLIERLASHPNITKDGQYLLLDDFFLRNTTVEDLTEILQPASEFRLVIHDVSNSSDRVFQTSNPIGDVLGRTTSCNIWVEPGEIHAARLTIIVWR